MKRSTDRVEAFSYGVVAIAISILVMNIPLPDELNIASLSQLTYSITIVILIVSIYFPSISIVFFLILPIVSSLINPWSSRAINKNGS